MQFDIIIIGGGMVGAAVAVALRSSHLNIALIDEDILSPSHDQRLIALNFTSLDLFKKMHLWEALQKQAAPINEVHVSHRGHFGIARFKASDCQMPALGYVIPAKIINTTLYENVDNITFIRPARLKSLSQDNQSVSIVVDTPQGEKSYSGKVLIGADGSHSTVRQLLNIPITTIDYKQKAIVTITELYRSHHNIAYERFQKEGAIAMLPLIGNRVATIWTNSNHNIDYLQSMDDALFLQHLQKYFGYRLGRLNNVSKRSVYPLQSIKAKQQKINRVILIGNALHTVHPIAAQGLNLAIVEITILTEYLKKQHADLSLQHLTMPQQTFNVQLSHYLSGLFSSDFLILNAARSIGMLGLDVCHPLKKQFIRKIMNPKNLSHASYSS